MFPGTLPFSIMPNLCHIGPVAIGDDQPLVILAGPCVLESSEINDQIAESLVSSCQKLHLPFIFKGSFDKANRSSIHSERGPGLEKGLAELERIKQKFGVPITTDVHEPSQAASVAQVAELLQIPAFMCRQTDLLMACAETGKAVNVKKGQFMAPSEMRHVVAKLSEGGCENMMLTERGTFFGYHRLVTDFIGLGDLMGLDWPVCFDVTHSTQLPGGGDGKTAGRPDQASRLARAAVAAGVHALFIECHPQPFKALSDASTIQSLDFIPEILGRAVAIREAIQTTI